MKVQFFEATVGIAIGLILFTTGVLVSEDYGEKHVEPVLEDDHKRQSHVLNLFTEALSLLVPSTEAKWVTL